MVGGTPEGSASGKKYRIFSVKLLHDSNDRAKDIEILAAFPRGPRGSLMPSGHLLRDGNKKRSPIVLVVRRERADNDYPA